VNFRLEIANHIYDLGEWRTRTENHVLHVPIVGLQCRQRMFGRHERDRRRRRQFVMCPVAAVELALEGDDGIEKRDVAERPFLHVGLAEAPGESPIFADTFEKSTFSSSCVARTMLFMSNLPDL